MSDAPKIDARAILADVKANLAKLTGCSRHQFAAQDNYPMGGKLTCLRCHGEMRLTDVGQYMRGYRAAGGNPDDILAGWLSAPLSQEGV